MIRSTTDEMLAARFDPQPYVNTLTGDRYPDEECAQHFTGGNRDLYTLAPRPEFIPSRLCFCGLHPLRRPEPNPILVEFREHLYEVEGETLAGSASVEIELIDAGNWVDATPAQIEDARKVLTRLAALKAVA